MVEGTAAAAAAAAAAADSAGMRVNIEKCQVLIAVVHTWMDMIGCCS